MVKAPAEQVQAPPVMRRRATGINANAAMRTDPHMPNTCLQDVVGASAVFYDTKVKVLSA